VAREDDMPWWALRHGEIDMENFFLSRFFFPVPVSVYPAGRLYVSPSEIAV